MAMAITYDLGDDDVRSQHFQFLGLECNPKHPIPNDNSGRAFGTFVGPAETIKNDAVFDRFGAVFDRLGAVFNHLGAVFDRLSAVFDRKRRRNEAFEIDSNCQAPQRAWQFESNSNAKVLIVGDDEDTALIILDGQNQCTKTFSC